MKILIKTVMTVVALLITTTLAAETIVLKSGRRIHVEKSWEENGHIKGKKYGATIGYPVSDVAYIEHDSVSNIESIGFDVWKLGMTIDDIMIAAERNDIPLHKEGTQPVHENFDPSIRQYAENTTAFYYNTELMGRSARINLNVTPVSKKLSLIKIHWPEIADESKSKFKREIEDLLISKYSEPMPWAQDDPEIEKLEWRMQQTGKIVLKAGAEYLDVEYSDLRITEMHSQEMLKVQDNNKEKEFQKEDIDKF